MLKVLCICLHVILVIDSRIQTWFVFTSNWYIRVTPPSSSPPSSEGYEATSSPSTSSSEGEPSSPSSSVKAWEVGVAVIMLEWGGRPITAVSMEPVRIISFDLPLMANFGTSGVRAYMALHQQVSVFRFLHLCRLGLKTTSTGT